MSRSPFNELDLQRKIPVQERSRAMVEAILEAAARVFVADGLDGATTNRIAEVAGVSVGSLYQYFPNKQVLARALMQRHFGEVEELRPAVLRGGEMRSLRERLGIAVRWQLDAHAKDPVLHQALSVMAPRILGMEVLLDIERLFQRTIRGVLEGYRDELGDRDLDLAAFIVAQCMESLTHGAVLHHPERLQDDALADEITHLLVAYLGA